MLKLLNTPQASRIASVVLVIVVAGVVGREAAYGMVLTQWMGAVAAVLGSVALAALLHTGPEEEEVAE